MPGLPDAEGKVPDWPTGLRHTAPASDPWLARASGGQLEALDKGFLVLFQARPQQQQKQALSPSQAGQGAGHLSVTCSSVPEPRPPHPRDHPSQEESQRIAWGHN